MDKIKTLTMEVRLNRIVIGFMMILFSISSTIAPLGGIAVIPLIGAVVVLSGILDWKSIPDLIDWIKSRKARSFPSRLDTADSRTRLARIV